MAVSSAVDEFLYDLIQAGGTAEQKQGGTGGAVPMNLWANP